VLFLPTLMTSRQLFHKLSGLPVGRVSYLVERLSTGWTVRGSNTGGGEIFRTCSNRTWGPPSLLYNGYRVLTGVNSGRGVKLTPHPFLVSWSWKFRAIPLILPWAVRPVQSLSACTRVHFTFYEDCHSRHYNLGL
jgi:hypothetical protein